MGFLQDLPEKPANPLAPSRKLAQGKPLQTCGIGTIRQGIMKSVVEHAVFTDLLVTIRS